METTTKAVKAEISIEEYGKLDIRMCHITSVTKVEKADKLYILEIDTGVDKRIVVSGIAQQFTPEQLIGRKMPFILNLPVRPIRGIESHGMIIMAEGQGGKLYDMANDIAETGAIVI